MATSTLPAGCSGGRLGRVRRCSHDMVSAAQPGRGYVLWAMDYFLGKIFFDNCVNVNGAPRIRTPSRRSGARSCHAPGGMAA